MNLLTMRLRYALWPQMCHFDAWGMTFRLSFYTSRSSNSDEHDAMRLLVDDNTHLSARLAKAYGDVEE